MAAGGTQLSKWWAQSLHLDDKRKSVRKETEIGPKPTLQWQRSVQPLSQLPWMKILALSRYVPSLTELLIPFCASVSSSVK